MYIRRKVFSLLQDETGEERYFSTTDIVYEQREFGGNKANKEATRNWKRQQALLETGLGSHTPDLATKVNNPKTASSLTKNQQKAGIRAEEAINKWSGKNQSNTNYKTDINSMDLNERINRRAQEKGGIGGNKNYFTNDQRKKARARIAEKSAASSSTTPTTPTTPTPKQVTLEKSTPKTTSKGIVSSMKGKWNNMGKAGKIGTIAGGAALTAGALYGAKKLFDKKKEFSLLEGDIYEERDFSNNKEESKLSLGDKINIKAHKYLTSKHRNAIIDAYGEKGDSSKLGKEAAKIGAVGGAVIGGLAGSFKGKKGAAIGAGIGAITNAGASYVGTRLGVAGNKKLRKRSGDFDTDTKMKVDRVRVANGNMTEEEFIKKWRS